VGPSAGHDRYASPDCEQSDIEILAETRQVPYREALRDYDRAQHGDCRARALIWLLEHAPVYTAGTSAAREELLDPGSMWSRRGGGRYTYHGPGQRVGYLMLDLRKRAR
jgi:lipoyl(octanoyl) transferase